MLPAAARRGAGAGRPGDRTRACSPPGTPGASVGSSSPELRAVEQPRGQAERRAEGVQVVQRSQVGAVPGDVDRPALEVPGRQPGRVGELGDVAGIPGRRLEVEPEQRGLGVVQLGDRGEHPGRGAPGPAARVGVDERHRQAALRAAPRARGADDAGSHDDYLWHVLPRAGMTRIRFDGRLVRPLSPALPDSRAPPTLRSVGARTRRRPAVPVHRCSTAHRRPRTVPRRRAGRRRRRRPAPREGARGSRGDPVARDGGCRGRTPRRAVGRERPRRHRPRGRSTGAAPRPGRPPGRRRPLDRGRRRAHRTVHAHAEPVRQRPLRARRRLLLHRAGVGDADQAGPGGRRPRPRRPRGQHRCRRGPGSRSAVSTASSGWTR